MRIAITAAVSVLSLALGGCMAADAMAQSPPSAVESAANSALIAAAVAAPDRPEDARELDEGRKPAEVLEWLALKPGMAAADLIPGSGYWTEIMAHVTGPSGSVVGFQPTQFYNSPDAQAAWSALEARAPGTSLVRGSFGTFDYAPNSFDFAMFSLNHHDLYWESEQYKIPRIDPDATVRSIYAMMRPGGIVAVIDHVGPAGDTREVVEKLHRIDPAVVIADYERAGFELVGTSDLLANPDDDHTRNVFNPEVRGKTDRFLFKFRKPAG